MPDRTCPEWSLKDNYQPKPMEKSPTKNCGNCTYYCPINCCNNPLIKPCK